jgi:hypothetical protein
MRKRKLSNELAEVWSDYQENQSDKREEVTVMNKKVGLLS